MKCFSHLRPCRPLSVALFCLGAALVALAGWQGVAVRNHAAPAGIEAHNVSFTGADLSAAEFSTRSIEDLRPGDQVLALEPETGDYAWKTVKNSLRRQTDHLRVLTVASKSNGSTQTIRTTDEHPFWVPERGWTGAGNLEAGDELLLAGGAPAQVVATSREEHPERVTVYNLTVEGYHTYFIAQDAGHGPLLVHNANKCVEATQGLAKVIAKNADEGLAANRVSKPFGAIVGGIVSPISETPGVIYKRINPKTGESYVGQAISENRYVKRQAEHNRALGVKHDFEILGNAKPGTTLDVLEEDMIRTHGGLQKQGGTLANKRHQMADGRYKANGGTIGDPN